MNKLILVAVAATAASGIAAAPAVAGLSHNPSFSHQLPVRVPSGAQPAKVVDDHHRGGRPDASPSPGAKASRGREAEPRDDRATPGAATSTSAHHDGADDNAAVRDVRDNDVNDDHGVDAQDSDVNDDRRVDVTVAPQPAPAATREAEPEPGDDSGRAVTPPAPVSSSHVEAGDERGGSSHGRQGSGRHDG